MYEQREPGSGNPVRDAMEAAVIAADNRLRESIAPERRQGLISKAARWLGDRLRFSVTLDPEGLRNAIDNNLSRNAFGVTGVTHFVTGGQATGGTSQQPFEEGEF